MIQLGHAKDKDFKHYYLNRAEDRSVIPPSEHRRWIKRLGVFWMIPPLVITGLLIVLSFSILLEVPAAPLSSTPPK